ncbi:PRC-barrel domain containing protein [Diaminobutyricibacter sp. McL0608]|uniref:PRC-barrel domain containing protein n=1 Tax=Leifsonia sp. McL0608 TaxID=3143537 RepID=UPI0031F2D94C
MILSDVMGAPVIAATGKRLGVVVDARLALDGPPDGVLAAARLHGLVVGRHAHGSFMGYERTNVNSPALIARFLRWRARGSFLVLWPDIASLADDVVQLRPDATQYSPKFDDSQI